MNQNKGFVWTFLFFPYNNKGNAYFVMHINYNICNVWLEELLVIRLLFQIDQ